MEFSEADPDLIEFLNDFYAKLISARSGLLEIFHFGDFYGNFIKNIFLLFFSFQTFNKVLKMLIDNAKLDGRSRHQIPKLSLHPYY